MNCPRCFCSDKVKSGKIKEVQRYRCKNCGCNYTVEIKQTTYSQTIKKQALHSDSKTIEVVEVDEMHTYIGQKKTTVGSGLLLIDMAKDSSISLLVVGATKQPRSSGLR